MPEHAQQVRTISNDGTVTESTRSTTLNDGAGVDNAGYADAAPAAAAAQPRSVLAARIIWYIAGVIIALLGLRFVLVLLGASKASAFVNLIYSLSHPFAVPFFGMFGYTLEYGVSRFETSTLVAMGVYALLAWGLARLVTIRRPVQDA